MTKSLQKITLGQSRDISFNRLAPSQVKVRSVSDLLLIA
jgi:hypothetical protein